MHPNTRNSVVVVGDIDWIVKKCEENKIDFHEYRYRDRDRVTMYCSPSCAKNILKEKGDEIRVVGQYYSGRLKDL